jgi:hypothetical protein
MDKSVSQFCPHLGLKHDPTTSFSYPSKGHVCFHAERKPTPELDFQRTTCLTAQHINCPVYKSPPGVRLPENIRQPRDQIKFQAKFILWALLIIILGLGAYLSIKYRGQLLSQIEGFVVPAWQQTQQALPPTLPPTATVEWIPTETQQPTATPTSTPEPTASPTVTRGPAVLALGTPIGGDIQFIIHRVIEGESLGQYASRYNTTEAAIRAVNFDMPSVLFIDWILVIPIDITDTTGLPAFQPIQMQEGGISVEAFANQLGVDVEDISLYNNLYPDRILQSGEWILVPRE